MVALKKMKFMIHIATAAAMVYRYTYELLLGKLMKQPDPRQGPGSPSNLYL